MVKMAHLNLPLDIMMMMSSDHFDNVTKMSFDVSDNKLLKNYKKIWEKVSSLMKIEFDSEPVYGDKYIKSYRDKYINKVI